jgi:hypothetical protein
MNRRVEFTLKLDDPIQRAIYETLSAALRDRRAGELIRNALAAFLLTDYRQTPVPSGHSTTQDRGQERARFQSVPTYAALYFKS